MMDSERERLRWWVARVAGWKETEAEVERLRMWPSGREEMVGES